MRIKQLAVALGAGVMMMTAAPVLAHHAFSAEFDVKKPLTLKGTLVKWEMINPHSWFHIEVKDPNGEVVEWMVEGGSPNSLIRQGVTKATLQIGMELVIEGYQAKDASKTAVGRNFVLPDGKRLFVGSPGGPDSPPAK
ncbi:MAG TPA: DUF6152 family protein [Vicinamibacterales bacterium]|jgi:hypothetical protein|nr:DUF6152 family protein [Vicinamibacterales bacterium]